MAGRGRGMTLPAWMTKAQNGAPPAPGSIPGNPGDVALPPPPPSSGDAVELWHELSPAASRDLHEHSVMTCRVWPGGPGPQCTSCCAAAAGAGHADGDAQASQAVQRIDANGLAQEQCGRAKTEAGGSGVLGIFCLGISQPTAPVLAWQQCNLF